MEIIDLPYKVSQLLEKLNSPNRLKRHLQIVHTTASELLDQIKQEWPLININENLVLFGAATHDIGKAIIKSELFGPGKKHEITGKKILTQLGFTNEESRFAFTHGNWKEDNLTIEDLLVSLSDKIWKGQRINELEEKVVLEISTSLEIDFWAIYSILDTILSQIAIGADKRTNWQNE